MTTNESGIQETRKSAFVYSTILRRIEVGEFDRCQAEQGYHQLAKDLLRDYGSLESGIPKDAFMADLIRDLKADIETKTIELGKAMCSRDGCITAMMLHGEIERYQRAVQVLEFREMMRLRTLNPQPSPLNS